MSNPQLLVTGEDIAGAPVEVLLATARALVSEAVDKVRSGTSGTTREELVEQVVACQQLQSTTWAVQAVRLAQVAAIEEVAEPGRAPREVRHAIGSYADEWLPQELGVRLGWSDRQTTNRLGEAVGAIRTVPRLFERTVDGSLDPRKLNIVADSLCGVRPKVARKVEGRLLAAIDDAQVSNDEDDQPISMTSTKLVRRTRRLLADLAPADAERAAKRSRANAKSVRAYPHHEPGLSDFHAVLPTEDAMRVMAAINELARHLHKDTTTAKSLDECRVDAFVDLLLGNASISTTYVVQIPLFPFGAGSDGGHSDVPAETVGDATVSPSMRKKLTAAVPVMDSRLSARFGSPGFGSSIEPQLRQLLDLTAAKGVDRLTEVGTQTLAEGVRSPSHSASPRSNLRSRTAPKVEFIFRARPAGRGHPQLTATAGRAGPDYRVGDAVVEGLGVIPAGVLAEMCRTFGTTVTRALVDMQTGATVETADQTYRPGARLRRFVVTRDQHCRFPGCTRPARLDDVDHVDPWPTGKTAARNLQCLCRHHHRAKHEGGWAVSMTPDGICTWTSRSGRRYVTHPAD